MNQLLEQHHPANVILLLASKENDDPKVRGYVCYQLRKQCALEPGSVLLTVQTKDLKLVKQSVTILHLFRLRLSTPVSVALLNLGGGS